MHGPINVKSPNNITKWQMGLNSAFKGLMKIEKISGERRVINHNDIYTIVLSDTMQYVSAFRENYQASILKHI
jgi:hypothetical protein